MDPFCVVEHRSREEVATVVDLIAEAVTHTRFVGQDPASDESVLMSIIHVSASTSLCLQLSAMRT